MPSMPAVRTTAGTEQAVQVPISLLQQPGYRFLLVNNE